MRQDDPGDVERNVGHCGMALLPDLRGVSEIVQSDRKKCSYLVGMALTDGLRGEEESALDNVNNGGVPLEKAPKVPWRRRERRLYRWWQSLWLDGRVSSCTSLGLATEWEKEQREQRVQCWGRGKIGRVEI